MGEASELTAAELLELFAAAKDGGHTVLKWQEFLTPDGGLISAEIEFTVAVAGRPLHVRGKSAGSNQQLFLQVAP